MGHGHESGSGGQCHKKRETNPLPEQRLEMLPPPCSMERSQHGKRSRPDGDPEDSQRELDQPFGVVERGDAAITEERRHHGAQKHPGLMGRSPEDATKGRQHAQGGCAPIHHRPGWRLCRRLRRARRVRNLLPHRRTMHDGAFPYCARLLRRNLLRRGAKRPGPQQWHGLHEQLREAACDHATGQHVLGTPWSERCKSGPDKHGDIEGHGRTGRNEQFAAAVEKPHAHSGESHPQDIEGAHPKQRRRKPSYLRRQPRCQQSHHRRGEDHKPQAQGRQPAGHPEHHAPKGPEGCCVPATTTYRGEDRNKGHRHRPLAEHAAKKGRKTRCHDEGVGPDARTKDVGRGSIPRETHDARDERRSGYQGRPPHRRGDARRLFRAHPVGSRCQRPVLPAGTARIAAPRQGPVTVWMRMLRHVGIIAYAHGAGKRCSPALPAPLDGLPRPVMAVM